MALVVLIESEMHEHAEADMRRWWRHHCRKHMRQGETYFEVASPVRWNAYEGVKRLASFGVKARVARRPISTSYDA